MSEILITNENFENEVLKSDIPVLIDFGAQWCGPCKKIEPFISEISEEYKNTIKVCKVDVDDEPDLAAYFHVSSIPSVLVIKNGNVIAESVGYKSKKDLIGLFSD